MSDELPAETYAADDVAAEANAKRDVARIAREDADVIRKLMHDKQGRAWMYRFLAKCNIFGDSFVPGQSDVTAFRLGQENIGRQLWLAVQDASIDLYMTMIREQQAEEQRVAEVRRKERKNRDEAENPQGLVEGMIDLPPPAGYHGGPPLPKGSKKDKPKK